MDILVYFPFPPLSKMLSELNFILTCMEILSSNNHEFWPIWPVAGFLKHSNLLCSYISKECYLSIWASMFHYVGQWFNVKFEIYFLRYWAPVKFPAFFFFSSLNIIQ